MLVPGQRSPGGDLLRPWGQLRVGRNDAKLELALISLLTILVPTLVELALELLDPPFWYMVRSMGRARSVVDEKGAVRRDGLLLADVPDGLVGERIVEGVVTLLALRDLHRDRRRAAVENRLPLVHFSADEAVEVIEALQARPPVEWSGDTRLPIGDVVILSDECGAVPALAQNLREHRRVLGNLPAVTRIAVANLRDHAGPGGMVVASGEQGGAGGRAERRGMEARVAQAHFRHAIEVRRGNLSSKGSPLSESRVVDQDDQHVRRPGGSLRESDCPRLRVLVGAADLCVRKWLV